jgi:hypothetical protein
MAKDQNNDGYYDDEYGEIQYGLYLLQNISMNITINFHYYHKDGPGTSLSSNTKINNVLYQGWNVVNGTFLTVVE